MTAPAPAAPSGADPSAPFSLLPGAPAPAPLPVAVLDQLLAVKLHLEAAERVRPLRPGAAWSQVHRAATLVNDVIPQVRAACAAREATETDARTS